MKLTLREQAVAHFVCEGWSNRHIAEGLGFSGVAAVEVFLTSLCEKLGVSGRLGLIMELLSAPAQASRLKAAMSREEKSNLTKAGLARARAAGKRSGRPVTVFDRDLARQLRGSGMSWRAIGKQLKVGDSIVRRGLAEVRSKGRLAE